ncbi:MAG TPA: SDR family oxidoreductase [Oceanobacillus sp.]|nr:SDR family oxidoreductase [Oceanobacillus sp.]
MKLLVIGGTRFVGRHIVEAALARGHEITLFHRGQSNADLFPEVEKIHGDREHDLDKLKGRRWDAVIDTCGYVPRIVRLSAEALADSVDHYVFISTISVYEDPAQAGADEDAPLKTIEDETNEDFKQFYGALKVLCERAAEAVLPGRVLHVRPGMIVGPHDHTDRFTYWAVRASKGGEVLVPGKPDRLVQMIDARDLGAWMTHLIEEKRTGILNATGPAYKLTWGEWMNTCKTVAGSDASFTWVSDEFLQEKEATQSQLPFWVPEFYNGIFDVSLKRAFDAGLTLRPLAETVRDTLAWFNSLDRPLSVGLSPEQEADLLAAWKETTTA